MGKKPDKKGLERKVKQLEESWKRALADYQNLEKRVQAQKEAIISFSNAQLLDKILPVLDELELCAVHVEDKGLDMVLSKFKEVLESEGVGEIKVKGKTFDPETMDAAEMVAGPRDKVIGVVLKGYKLGDKVLRPAKVRVGEGKKGARRQKVKKAERETLRGEYV